MADLVTRLKLDDKQFRDNLAKSKKEVEMFKNAGSNILGTLTKMGTALGVAASVGEGFNKMMQSSQTFGDKAAESIAAAKGAVNEFFYALGTGDFNNFLSGMDNMIEKAKQAQAALDQLGNTKISYQFVRGENRRAVAVARTQANNLELSKAERQAGFDAWGKGLKKMKEDAKVYEGEIIAAVKALALENTKLNVDDISIEDIKRIARLDINVPSFRKAEKDNLAKQYEEYLQQQKKLNRERGQGYVIEGKIITYAERENLLAKKYKDAILTNSLLVRKNDDEWGSIVAKLQEADSATEELGSQQEEYNNALRTFKKEAVKPIATIKPEKVVPKIKEEFKEIAKEGSLAFIRNVIKEFEIKLTLAVDDDSRKKIQSQINILKDKEREMMLNAGIISPTKIEPIKAEVIDRMNLYSDSIRTVSSLLTAMQGINADSIAGVMQWTSVMCSSIASVIDIMKKFDEAKKIAAATDAAITATQVANSRVKVAANTAEGASESGKQAAKTPFVGWLMVAGAVAAALAAFASIPSFSKGGVFKGGKTFGDMNIARVNAGEMILNNHQQKNLWNLLNGTTSATNNINSGEVKFQIEGSKLVGVLNNYNKKMGKA